MTTYGPNYVAEVPTETGDGNGWGNLAHMVGPPDGAFASTTISGAESTKFMLLDFGLDDAELHGPVYPLANIVAQSVDGAATLHAQLFVNGVAVGDEKSIEAPDTGGEFALYQFGGPDDDWGADLDGVSAADVRLGVRFSDPQDGSTVVAAGDATNFALTDTDPPPARTSRLTRVSRLQRHFRV